MLKLELHVRQNNVLVHAAGDPYGVQYPDLHGFHTHEELRGLLGEIWVGGNPYRIDWDGLTGIGIRM